MDRYEQLANGIVKQAATDYRRALAYLEKTPKGPAANLAKRTVSECERFFTGEWINVLTNVDGKSIMDRIKGEYL